MYKLLVKEMHIYVLATHPVRMRIWLQLEVDEVPQAADMCKRGWERL